MANAPSAFKYIWAVAKFAIDEHIRDLFVVTNHANYLEVLSQYVDPEVMPPCMTPNGEGCGKGMPGYFENIHWEAGHVPTGKQLDEYLWKEEQLALQRRKRVELEQEGIWKEPIPFVRQETALSVATATTVLSCSDMSVATKSMMTGTWEGPSVIAFPSENSLSTLGEF